MGRAQRVAQRSGIGRAAKLAALAVGVVMVTSACSAEDVIAFGWPRGVTPQAEAMREFWLYAVIAALVVGVITWGAMFWAIIAYRKRKGDDDSLPRQSQYNLPVEVVFTVIPIAIVLALFGMTVNVQNYVDSPGERPDLRVGITAFQWNWDFSYPDAPSQTGETIHTLGTSEEIPILVLPTNRRIEFIQQSNDVIHSFWVPEFLFKRDVFPYPEKNDQDNVWQIDRIDRPGAFVGRCAELCGTYHAFMNFEVRALEPALFDRWLQLRGQVNPATGELYTAGEALAALGCGELCSPRAITTYPFNTDRTLRSASLPAGS